MGETRVQEAKIWVMLAGAVIALLGSFMPWISAGTFSVSGIEGDAAISFGKISVSGIKVDGAITAAMAVILAAAAWNARTSRLSSMIVFVGGAIVVWIPGRILMDLGPLGSPGAVGSGILITMLGGLIAVVGGLVSIQDDFDLEADQPDFVGFTGIATIGSSRWRLPTRRWRWRMQRSPRSRQCENSLIQSQSARHPGTYEMLLASPGRANVSRLPGGSGSQRCGPPRWCGRRDRRCSRAGPATSSRRRRPQDCRGTKQAVRP